MPQRMQPQGESRDDYAIFAALAGRLGVAPAYTEGRGEMQWVEALYEGWRAAAQKTVAPLPPFAEFWAQGLVKLEPRARHRPRRRRADLQRARQLPRRRGALR